MKKTLIGIAAGLLVGAAATWLLTRGGGPAKPDADDAPKADAAAPANPLRLTPDQRQKAGIGLGAPASVELRPETEGFGRVIDPTPFVGAETDVESAEADLTAARKELDRSRTLYNAGRNLSAQSLEAAEASEAKARAQADAARARLITLWGAGFAARADTGLARGAVEKGRSLGRIDFAPGAQPAAVPGRVEVEPAGGEAPLGADVLGEAPAVDPQLQGRGYFVELGGFLPAGTALRASVPVGQPQKALTVPAGAVVYHEGSAFVFVLGSADTFERRRVELGRSVGDAYVVQSGLEPSDRIAVAGAQQLLSNELQAQAGPPD